MDRPKRSDPAGPGGAEEPDQRFRLLAEHAGDLLSEITLDGRVVYASPNHQDVLGFDPSADSRFNVVALVHPDDAPRVVRVLAGADRPSEARSLAYRGRVRDGSWRWFETTGRAFRAADGATHIVATTRDVTEARRALEALEQTQGILRGVLESALDGIMAFRAVRNDAGRIVDFEWLLVNPAAERIIGRAAASLIGRRLLEEMPGNRSEGLFGRYVRVVESGQPLDHEHRYAHEGIDRWFRSVVAPMGDGFAVTFSDITERRRLEEQLRQSQKMEAVGRLAGGVAHDFNNVITAIIGYTEMLLAQARTGDPSRVEMREILDACRHASSLTAQLLAFGRQQHLAPEVLDAGAFVVELEALLRRLIGEHIALEIAVAPDAGRVRADRSQIQQVLLNLAVNARDAMPGGGTLRVEVDRLVRDRPDADGQPAGDWLRLRVSDTGCGMDDEVRSRIFDPFFTTKAPGRGTGLGLATVYGIVTQSGGHVLVSSRVGDGSTFTVLLPRVEEPGAEVTAAAESPRVPRGQETVLLVEDEERVRRVVRSALETSGYTVVDAADGRLAFAAFEARPDAIDLVLTDVVMPEMSGPELARRLRARRPGLRVLYVSGYTDAPGFRRGRLEPGTDFLAKPFSLEGLTASVRRLLDEPVVPKPDPTRRRPAAATPHS